MEKIIWGFHNTGNGFYLLSLRCCVTLHLRHLQMLSLALKYNLSTNKNLNILYDSRYRKFPINYICDTDSMAEHYADNARKHSEGRLMSHFCENTNGNALTIHFVCRIWVPRILITHPKLKKPIDGTRFPNCNTE